MALPTRNTVVAQDVPFLQWANGLMRARSSSSGSFASLVGWITEYERDDELDAAAKKAGIPGIEVRHQGRDGRGDLVKRYWSFGPHILLYPITTGPVAGTMTRALRPEHVSRMGEAGLGVRWPREEMDGSRGKSRFALRALVHPLVEAGYRGPLQITATGLMSDRLLAALVAHVEACAQADRIKGREIFPAELAWPLAAGEETSFGSGQSTTVVPMVCTHPRTIDARYVEEHWRPEAAYGALEQAWPQVQAWASDYCAAAQSSAAPDGAAKGGDGRAAPLTAHYAADGLYVPGPEDIEECIARTDDPQILEAYRQRALDLREQRALSVADQMRLAAMIEDKLAHTLDSVQF
jgi:hypothetical protein